MTDEQRAEYDAWRAQKLAAFTESAVEAGFTVKQAEFLFGLQELAASGLGLLGLL